MKINKVHCLFEQSGTFKKEFQKLGIHAEDYDICNDFGETDHVVDLFEEINKAYDGKLSIFDNIEKDDLIFAFFPCTRFEAYNCMLFQAKNKSMKGWNDIQRLEYSMEKHEELHKLYMLICKLFIICLRGGGKMIVENPYTQPHYLTSYFPIEPNLIDSDRTKNGDYFKKPTQYWFVNCQPENNIIFEPIEYVKRQKIESGLGEIHHGKSTQVKRSMIHPQYASRFIKQYILDAPNGVLKI